MSHLNVRENKVPSPNAQQEPRSVVNARQPLKRRTMMFNLKRVFLTTALVVSGALVAPLGVGAATTSFLTPAGNTGCNMTDGGGFIKLTPDDAGGTWPIPFTNSTGGESYEYRYILATNVSNAQSNVQVALNAKLPTPVTSDGTTEISNFQPACKGTLSNNNFAVDVCDARIASLTGSSSGHVSLYMHDIKTHAAVGGATAKSGGFIANCSKLEVPISAPPSFASILTVMRLEVGGLEYCIALDTNGCPPTGTAPYLCSDINKTPLLETPLQVVDGTGSHTLTWVQSTRDIPGCPTGILALNPTTCYITIGGRQYKTTC